MNHEPHRLAVVDLEPAKSDFLSEAIAGLSDQPRTLPCKYFYDENGAELFQKICELPEYYITRAETAILRLHAHQMARCIGARCELIGLGTGAGTKTRVLLEELEKPAVYVPVDISKEQLERSTALFRKLFPKLEILPVCADYLEPFDLPLASRKAARKIVYFPGSTIGNFEPPGVTAQFNLNLLARANRELGANFDLRQWRHYAVYNPDEGRIEIYLISETDQTVRIKDRQFHFHTGEKIITEYSYKHTPPGFIDLAHKAGFEFVRMWTDNSHLFGVFYFTVKL